MVFLNLSKQYSKKKGRDTVMAHTDSLERNVIDKSRVASLLERVAALDIGRTGTVAMLVEKPAPGVHRVRQRVRVVPGVGFAGDHARKSFYRGKLVKGREVSAVSLEVLRTLGVDPFVVGDNLVTSGIDLAALGPGDQLQIGEVLLERSAVSHRPCTLFRNRTSSEAFAVASQGYRGALFTVLQGGILRRDDTIIPISNAVLASTSI